MSLQQRIDEDLKDAMRAKNAARLSVLRMAKAALKNAAIEKGGADAEHRDFRFLFFGEFRAAAFFKTLN